MTLLRPPLADCGGQACLRRSPGDSGECPKGQSPFDKAISPSLLDQQKERRGQGMRDFHIYFIADAPAGRI